MGPADARRRARVRSDPAICASPHAEPEHPSGLPRQPAGIPPPTFSQLCAREGSSGSRGLIHAASAPTVPPSRIRTKVSFTRISISQPRTRRITFCRQARPFQTFHDGEMCRIQRGGLSSVLYIQGVALFMKSFFCIALVGSRPFFSSFFFFSLHVTATDGS